MLYSDLQAQIIKRLDNRTDLAAVVYDYSQARINYWKDYLFYSSDIVDDSLVTVPGQIFYNLPAGIRFVRAVRLLLNNNLTGSVVGATTTTAAVTLPAATIPVASTANFPATSGVITVGGNAVFYNSVDATDFLGCVGVMPNPQLGVYPAGTIVNTLNGVWYPLEKVPYERIINYWDVLSPGIRTIPSGWAQINLQLRLFPQASASWALEVTGNGAPAPPLVDGDDNYWTEDAAWLIIASTTNEVRRGYLGDEARQQDLTLEQIEKNRLKKVSFDLMDNTQIRMHL